MGGRQGGNRPARKDYTGVPRVCREGGRVALVTFLESVTSEK